MNTFDKTRVTKEPRRPWVSPVLKIVGTIGDIVGDNKMSHTLDSSSNFGSHS
jgi:hypothetical protein